MAKGDDIEERLVAFAVAVINLSAHLPKSYAGKHIAQQMLRSGTSPAPNYAEARAAESRKDFVHKLRVALKELNETHVWIKIIRRSQMLPTDILDPVQQECQELCKIINASTQTARRT